MERAAPYPAASGPAGTGNGALAASVEQVVVVAVPERVGIRLGVATLHLDVASQPPTGPQYPWPPTESQAFYGPGHAGTRQTFQIKVFLRKPHGFLVGVTIAGTPLSLPPADWYIVVTEGELPARPLYAPPPLATRHTGGTPW